MSVGSVSWCRTARCLSCHLCYNKTLIMITKLGWLAPAIICESNQIVVSGPFIASTKCLEVFLRSWLQIFGSLEWICCCTTDICIGLVCRLIVLTKGLMGRYMCLICRLDLPGLDQHSDIDSFCGRDQNGNLSVIL